MFRVGQEIEVPCQIQGGAFSNENLVSIETEDGLLSGFADAKDVRQTGGERGLIRATVVDVDPSRGVRVRIYGSFFTTASGMMEFSSSWANTHLQEA